MTSRRNPLMPREDQYADRRNGHAAPRDEFAPDQRGDEYPAPAPDNKPASPATFTADVLMRMELPPPRWAVDEILPEGLSLLAGKPKLGKSWLALHLALAVSAGGVALGHIHVEGGSVLYLALEDTKRRLQSRIRRLMGPGEQPSPRLHLAHDWPRLDNGGETISAWIASHCDARLVIVDTWAKFRPIRPGRSENNYDCDYADGARVKAIADRHGVPILIVHHCRKMGASDAVEEVAGSVGLTGACDGILVMRRERGQCAAALTVTGRDVDEVELALAFDKTHCLWRLLGDAETIRLSKERSDVIDALRQAGRPLKPSELAPILGKPINSAKQLLWKMSCDGQIQSVGSGRYTITDNPDNPHNRSNRSKQDDATVTGSAITDNRDNDTKTPWG